MHQNKRFNSLLTSVLIVFFSCHIASGASIDNILKLCFYTQNDSSYLILHESMFHATSGSYEKGNLRTQGYNTSRISVYELQAGRLIAQRDMGVMDSAEACYMLGCSTQNLWIFNKKHKSGLQSLHPLTLEKHISQATIYKSLNTSIGRFYEPPWQEVIKYYGYDPIQQKLIITNDALQQYYIDAETFATQPIREAINLSPEPKEYIKETAKFKDSIWQLSGYEYMAFKCGSFTAEKPTYLYGKFLLENNKLRLFKHFMVQYESATGIQDHYNKAAQTATKQKNDLRLENAKKNIQNLIHGTRPDDVLLQSDIHSFYVLSKSENKPEARLKISKITSEKFGQFNEQWSVSPAAMFYNVAQARNTRIFQQYFGDVSPEFNYQIIEVLNNKLIIIYLMHLCCIDVNTGNILFQFKLR